MRVENANKARDKLEDILNDAEYAAYYDQSKSIFEVWWEELKRWFAEMLGKIFPSIEPTSSSSGTILLIIISVLVIVLLGILILYLRRRGRNRTLRHFKPIQSTNEMDWTYERHLIEAEKHERSESYTRSTRHMFLALLLYFHEKGWLEARIWKTNWDYYDELRKIDQKGANQFYNFALLFDEVTYGERTVQKEEYESYRNDVLKMLESAGGESNDQLEG